MTFDRATHTSQDCNGSCCTKRCDAHGASRRRRAFYHVRARIPPPPASASITPFASDTERVRSVFDAFALVTGGFDQEASVLLGPMANRGHGGGGVADGRST